MSARVLDAPPAEGEALLHEPRMGRWLLFRDPVRVLEAGRTGDVPALLDAVESAVTTEGLAAAGWISYEAAPAFDSALRVSTDGDFPPAWFGLYRGVEEVRLPAAPPPQETMSWSPTVSAGEYAAAFGRIREEIREGATYQVNFTFRLRSRRVPDPWMLFLRMVRAQGDVYGAFLRHPVWDICSSSPELFLMQEGGRVVSEPMKGTRPRGLWTEQDRGMAAALGSSAKDRAENLMIVDMVRNDLGRRSPPGTVRVDELFTVRRYPTVWQMVSRVSAPEAGGLRETMQAMFPPASITGAPKASTMGIIRELETTPRRIYTGAIGFLLPGGGMQFNVAIRTVLVDRRTGAGEYGVGSGVVWRSDAKAEYEECLTKARVLHADLPEFRLLETMRWEPGAGVALLPLHLERLAGSAEYFGWRFPERHVMEGLRKACEGLQEPSRLRLLVDQEGGCTVDTGPIPAVQHPYRVRPAAGPVDPAETFLYHKTTHRGVYERVREEAGACDDVLLWNTRGELTESCIGNLILEIGGRWYTPPPASGLLPGVQRSHLLATGRVEERVLVRSDLAAAERVLLCNALRGVWEVEVYV